MTFLLTFPAFRRTKHRDSDKPKTLNYKNLRDLLEFVL